MPAAEELVIRIKSEKTGTGDKDAKSGLEGLKKAAKTAVAAFAAFKAAQGAVDLLKFGAAVQRQAQALDGLAKAAGTSGDAITKAIQSASGYTIDRMTAMSAASKAMMLDVAKAPEQFERLTKVATSLGRAMGQDAAKSIDDFVTAAGRQSMMIADNLGLTVKMETANANYARALGKTVNELTQAEKKQAFLNEMLRQGEVKMGEMGDLTEDTAAKLERMNAQLADLKANSAIAFAEIAEGSGALDWLNERMAMLPDTLERVGRLTAAWGKAFQTYITGGGQAQAMDVFHGQLNALTIAQEDLYESTEKLRYAHTQTLTLYDDSVNALSSVSYMAEDASVSFRDFGGTQDEIMRTVLAASEAMAQEEEAIRQAAAAAAAAKETMLGMAMDVHSQQKAMAESAEDLAKEREQIEATHQEKLAAIQAKAQSKAIKIDEAAEREKLQTLQERLDIALQQQSEFTDKTKESTQMSKELQIRTLQEQIAEQQATLDAYYSGRLTTQGANVEAELTKENERYQREMALMQEQQAAQEEAQRASMGRMLLQQFDAWAQMSGVSAEKAIEMRTAIAVEYGLMDEKAAETTRAMVTAWDQWAAGSKKSAGEIVGQIGQVVSALDSIPRKVNVVIDVSRTGAKIPGGPALTMQHGGYVSTASLALVGERGPEMVALPAGARVYSNRQTRNMVSSRVTQNFFISGWGGDIQSLADELAKQERLKGHARYPTLG